MKERFKAFVFTRILLLVVCGLRLLAAQTCSTDLPTLSNGVFISGNTGGPYSDGHMINYMCSNNFATANGPISCTCDVTTDPKNPAWSCSPIFTTTVCRRICLDPPIVPAYSHPNPTDISGQFLAGDEIVYSCDGDLSPGEPTTITCEDMGPSRAVWSTTLIPNCTCDMDSFPQITVGPGTNITGPLAPNSPVNYSCSDANFSINGTQTNQCNGTGAYTETAPSCEGVCVESPPVFTNGIVSSTNTAVAPYFANEVISYECSDPFQPNPLGAALTCMCIIDDSNDSFASSWRCDPQEVTTTCQACNKQSLPPYENAEVEENLPATFQLSSTVTYTCTTSSSFTCTCTAGETAALWECKSATDSKPASFHIYCDASPPTNTNGAVSSSNTAVSLLRIILLNAYIMMIFYALA